MAKLILFDVDGTLTDSGGAGKRAFERTLEELTGIKDGFRGVNYAGKTDIQILREALTNLSLNHDRQLSRRFFESYPRHLKAEISKTNGRIKPGVKQLLEKLKDCDHFFLGLLTGNVEVGARLKLESFGLNPFFPLGAFGGDEEDRNKLLPVAVRRLMEATRVQVDFSECVVVGDPPLDVECAKVHGAGSIAVATGPYSVEVLDATHADLVLPDLTGTDRIITWLRGR